LLVGSCSPLPPEEDTTPRRAIVADIVVAGGFYDDDVSEGVGALWRFKENGRLDKSFAGGDGVLTFDTGPGSNEPWRIARLPNGQLIGAGWAETGLAEGDYDALVARFNANGTLDTTFGFGGLVQHNPTDGSNDWVAGLALRDGKIFLAIAGQGDVTLMRLNANGSRDRSWGSNDGEVTNDNGGDESPSDLRVDSSGRLVVVGYAGSLFIARFMADGSPDGSFGNAGWVMAPYSGGFDSVVITKGGKLVAAGTDFVAGDMLAARFLP
jgi:uncharacterized delta-60 repeat protein